MYGTESHAELRSRVELAELRPSASYRDIHLACLQADHYGLGAVVVHPAHCARASRFLRRSSVRLVATVGFPYGAFTIPGKDFETRDALAQGAMEIDYVVNIGALLSGNAALVSLEMQAVRKAAGHCVLKASIESRVLSGEQVALACRLAADAGIDVIETSTGFGPDEASVEDVRALCREAAGRLRVGAAGCIESRSQADALVNAGAACLRAPFAPFMAGSAHEQT